MGKIKRALLLLRRSRIMATGIVHPAMPPDAVRVIPTPTERGYATPPPYISEISPAPFFHFTLFRADPKGLDPWELALPRYNGIGSHRLAKIAPRRQQQTRASRPRSAKTKEDEPRKGNLNSLPNEPIFPPNPNKMKPLVPSIAEPIPPARPRIESRVCVNSRRRIN
jgi:hypothetical protein